jgi:ABC-type Fe3+/spermidine/putrescine transport system ATPase subunit
MRVELKRIQRATGVTAIFVTHDQEEAFGIGDRVAVMNLGRLEQLDVPEKIYGAPQTPFVARFIGRSNRVRGTFDAGAGLLRVNGHAFATTQRPAGGGTSQELYLRPEAMRLSRQAAPDSSVAGNSVAGTIADVSYGGTLISYRVDSPVGSFEIAELGSGGAPYRVGEPVHVGWAPEAGALLPVVD